MTADPQDERRAAEALDVRFERADVAPGVVARWAIGLGLVSIVSATVSVWLLVFLRRHEAARDPQRPALYFKDEGRQPEGVRLQSQPFVDLQALRAHENLILHSYGWVDPAAGTVHIPIEDAMRLYLARQEASAARAVPPPGDGDARVPTDSAPVPPPEKNLTPSPSPRPAGGRP
jgi:hypothetical protein